MKKVINPKASFFNKEYFMDGTRSAYGGTYPEYVEEAHLNNLRQVISKVKGMFNVNSVLDIGCARGYTIRAFREIAIKAIGIEISKWAVENADEFAKPFIRRGDVRKKEVWKHYDDKSVDMVMAWDVMEHINENKVDFVIKHLCRVSNRYVLIKVALNDTQLDASHITIKDTMWWINKFIKRGYEPVYLSKYIQMDGQRSAEICFERVPKVVYLIPCYNSEDTLPIVLKYVKRQQPDKVVFCENNSVDSTVDIINNWDYPDKELIQLHFEEDAVDKCDTVYDIIAQVRDTLLERARELDPDFIIFLDSCVIPLDPLFTQKLIDKKVDIVGAPYYRHFPEGYQIATIFHASEGFRFNLARVVEPPGKFGEVVATSFGAVCIARRVFQDKRLNFMPVLDPERLVSEDFGYCMKAIKFGYKTYIDCTITALHLELNRDRPWSIGKTGKLIKFRFGKPDDKVPMPKDIVLDDAEINIGIAARTHWCAVCDIKFGYGWEGRMIVPQIHTSEIKKFASRLYLEKLPANVVNIDLVNTEH